MKASNHRRAFLMPLLALFALPGQSQELTLFQGSDADNRRMQFAQAAAQVVNVAPDVSAPSLSVLAIYRFGNDYHVSFQDDEGARYKATWTEGQQESVPVLNGYQLQGVESRSVMLGMPAGMSCRQRTQSGASCLGGNMLQVTFSETEPARSDNDNRRNRNRNRNRNENQTVSFSFGDDDDDNDERQEQLQRLIEAARNGDDDARREVARTLGNRGRGGRGGGFGGRGGGNGGDDDD